LHGGVDLGRPGQRHTERRLPRGRVHVLELAAGGGGDQPVSDQQTGPWKHVEDRLSDRHLGLLLAWRSEHGVCRV
jgi:hypothetical protein